MNHHRESAVSWPCWGLATFSGPGPAVAQIQAVGWAAAIIFWRDRCSSGFHIAHRTGQHVKRP
jgi:hypothetical protein